MSSGIYIIEGQSIDESSSEISKAVLELEKQMSSAYKNKDPRVEAIFEELSPYGEMTVRNADRLSSKANGKFI